jgi:uncharacterized membrane protein
MCKTAAPAGPDGPSVTASNDARPSSKTSPEESDGLAVVARRVVIAGTGVYAGLFAGAAVLHFLAFQSAHLDLGTMTQSVWSTAHGNFLEMTNEQGQNTMRFAYHVDPLLALLTPLWLVWPSGVMLVVFQAVAVASGALPVYWLARKHLCSVRAAAHFAFAYLLFPATQFNAFTIASGFHAVAIALPLILYAIWFLDENRLWAFAATAMVAVTTKEEIGAAIGCLGIWHAVRHRKRLAGALIFVAGAAITILNFTLVIPHYSPTGASPFEDRYTAVGTTPSGMLRTLIHDPVAYVHAVATGHKLVYLALLLLPFLALWSLEPFLLLGAVPDLVINLLSAKPEQTNIEFPHTAGIVPFVVAASIFGLARLRRDPDRVSLWILGATATIALALSPITLGHRDLAVVISSSPTRDAKVAALRLVPDAVPVSASNQLGAYVAARRYSAIFPRIGAARWAIVDRADPTYGNEKRFLDALARIETSSNWQRVFSSHGIMVFRRL